MSEPERYAVDNERIAAETMAGEAVILDLSSGDYYSLHGAGGLGWALLSRGHSAEQAAARLGAHFGVPAGKARADVDRLLGELLERELLVAHPNAVPEEPTEQELPPEGEYTELTLEVFTDMGELLALDPPMPGMREVPWRAPSD